MLSKILGIWLKCVLGYGGSFYATVRFARMFPMNLKTYLRTVGKVPANLLQLGVDQVVPGIGFADLVRCQCVIPDKKPAAPPLRRFILRVYLIGSLSSESPHGAAVM
jgi:hypothetical protein